MHKRNAFAGLNRSDEVNRSNQTGGEQKKPDAQTRQNGDCAARVTVVSATNSVTAASLFFVVPCINNRLHCALVLTMLLQRVVF